MLIKKMALSTRKNVIVILSTVILCRTCCLGECCCILLFFFISSHGTPFYVFFLYDLNILHMYTLRKIYILIIILNWQKFVCEHFFVFYAFNKFYCILIKVQHYNGFRKFLFFPTDFIIFAFLCSCNS